MKCMPRSSNVKIEYVTKGGAFTRNWLLSSRFSSVSTLRILIESPTSSATYNQIMVYFNTAYFELWSCRLCQFILAERSPLHGLALTEWRLTCPWISREIFCFSELCLQNLLQQSLCNLQFLVHTYSHSKRTLEDCVSVSTKARLKCDLSHQNLCTAKKTTLGSSYDPSSGVLAW